MPELPEVERARKLIEEACKGFKIASVDVSEDKIVYTGGTDHNAFAKEVTGRTITGCERKGKTFWITLSGSGRFPVLHFGMTGMIQLKGHEPTWYRRKPRESSKTWPPRFYKFVLKLEPQDGSVSNESVELAFLDGRRLGRIRLVPAPVEDHPPVSALGFDPVLCHPTFEEFQKLLAKKKGTVKGMIMDQAFSAGVGNWVADEVLYQARLHPACPVPHLSEQNIKDLHYQLRHVPLTAVSVNADSKQFPEDWLFRWRWGKGAKHEKGSKKGKAKAKAKVESGDEEEGEEVDVKPKNKQFLALPDGSPATITFIEVGGRTTAVVAEVQRMPEGVEIKPKITKGAGGKASQKKRKADDVDGDDSDGGSGSSELSESEEDGKPAVTTPRQKAVLAAGKRKAIKSEPEAVPEIQTRVKVEDSETLKKRPRNSETSRKADMPNRKSRMVSTDTDTKVKVKKELTSGKRGRVSRPSRGDGKGNGGRRRRGVSSGSSGLSEPPESG